MFVYGSQLILSITIRVIAAVWSVYLIYRIRNWRIAILTVMLSLMAFQQMLRFYEVKSEMPGLVVSILAFLMTYIVGNLIITIRMSEHKLKAMNEELEIKVQQRTAEIEKKNRELEEALSQVKTLNGMLPICANCKKIRNDSGYWEQIEQYIGTHTEAVFSHSLCPECVTKLYPGLGKTGSVEK